MENRKTFTYNGVNSADYGLYISGDSVYNAPSRVYEMVDIAGRNGQLAIDQGRFENIEVTYPAFIFAETQTEFAQRLREIRAWLMSPVGYQRLEDTYHPDEFRMSIYMSGLEADPTHYNEAGEFELTFNCKPQRFLKSGEEEITIGEWGETQTVSGSIATFEAESNTGIKSLVVGIEPNQSGSGDPSPDNVRPISGWDSVRVGKSGKNLVPNVLNSSATSNGITVTVNSDGTFTANGTATGLAVFNINYEVNKYLKDGVAYILSGCTGGNYGTTYGLQLANDGGSSKAINNNGDTAFTMTTDTTRLRLLVFSGATLDNVEFKPMIRLATDTDPTYEPYQGETITKSLGQTVYGGTLDLISGVLTVTQIKKTLDPSKVYSAMPYKTGFAKAYIVDGLDENAPTGTITDFLCDTLPPKSMYSTAEMGLYIYQQKNIAISVPFSAIDGYSDVGGNSNYKNAIIKFLTDNSVSVVYPLATPTTYQLTSEQIETILGVNNIWADSGEVSVEYGADPNILVNPSPFEALPIFEVVGVGSLTVGNITVTITGESTQDIFIDSDIMEAYEDDNGAIISRNDRISLSGTNFPTLGTDTGITYTGLTSVTVTPRWWTI